MTKSLFILSLLLASSGLAQPAIKLYGYSRFTTPGMVPERNPSDPAAKPWNAPVEYLLYVSMAPATTVRPAEVWINGRRYAITTSMRVPSPVLSPANEKLVPKTTNKVLSLQWGKELPLARTPAWLKTKTRDHEMVLVYSWKGKKYYKALRKTTRLETVFGE